MLLLAGGSGCHLEMTQPSHYTLSSRHATCNDHCNERDSFFSSPFTLKTGVPPLAPNEYQPLLLFLGSCWQTYSLSTRSSATRGRLNRSSIPPRPAPSTLCWHAIDHVALPPPPPPPRTCQQHVSRPLPRWETVPLPLGDLLYYYTSWQWALVSV